MAPTLVSALPGSIFFANEARDHLIGASQVSCRADQCGTWRQPELLKQLLAFVVHRFDVVAVGIENESAIIVRVIMRSHSRRTVVPAAGLESSMVKCVDGPKARMLARNLH